MALLRLRDVTLAFGAASLLEDAVLEIEPGERVALVGRNGEGKSTLLRLIDGDLEPDAGEVERAAGTGVALLAQQVPRHLEGTVFDRVAEGLGDLGDLVTEYHRIGADLSHGGDHGKLLKRLEDVQHALEAAGGWQLRNRVEATLTRLRLDAEADVATLSGGLKRRVLLARALVAEPRLLLLDEPTNHLDIPAIEGLEEILLGLPASGSILFVTHDRAFLKRLATRIVELDRGRLRAYPGDYAAYLRRKEEEVATETSQNAVFDKKLSQEETWIRQGIKARRTRNEGRLRALEKMREERHARRVRSGQAKMRLAGAERSGKRVIEAAGVSFAYGERVLVRDFSTKILRGDKVGVLGPNGSGKTTLLRLLLGELKPEAGSVEHGTRLEVAYFDQYRATLDEDRSVADSVADGNDRVTVGDKTRHVISHLQDFLFPPTRARSPVSSLSGGERNRLLLARLFTRPFNVLVMDEPTNDLDTETLELLEERLLDYQGTLLLVSHDRLFIDNVVTSTLVLEGGGRVGEYAGGYSDYLLQRQTPGVAKNEKTARVRPVPARPKPPKRSYREEQELAALPARIEALEAEQAELHARLADPGFYRSGGGEIAAVKGRLESLEGELLEAYERWQTLEAKPG